MNTLVRRYNKLLGLENEQQGLLPSGYTQLTYIQGDGASYINTEIKSNGDNFFDIKAQLVEELSTNQDLFYAHSGLTTFNANAFVFNGTGANYGKSSIFYASYSTLASKNWDYDIHTYTTAEEGTYYRVFEDGVRIFQTAKQTFEGLQDVYLFSNASRPNVAKRYADKLRIFYCKIYRGSDLVRDLIPCVRNIDSAVGMYDLVEERFFANQGTGEFIKGEVV